MDKTDLKSSVKGMGEIVTQVITCCSGIKKTIRGIKTNTIENGQFTKFWTVDGRMVLINDANVFCIEVFGNRKVA